MGICGRQTPQGDSIVPFEKVYDVKTKKMPKVHVAQLHLGLLRRDRWLSIPS